MALGTHGHMKVAMNGKIASDDVICMNLYKRVYPKWNYQPVCYYRVHPNAVAATAANADSASASNGDGENMMDFMD